MKILWLCNSLLDEASSLAGVKNNKPESWLSGAFNQFRNRQDFQFVYLYPSIKQTADFEIDNFTFVSYIQKKPLKFEKNQIQEFRKILQKFNPDVIHIFGTEYCHTYSMVKACEDRIDRVIISIQGLVSVYAKHYFAFMPERNVRKFTLRDLLRWNNIYQQKKTFQKRGCYEEDSIRLAKNIIGRTDWDRACVTRLNKNIRYHFCNETLRESFYNQTWSYDDCEKYSIFVSQSLYPIKGFHLMLEAMKDVIDVYPQAHLYTTGSNPFKLSKKRKLMQSYYSCYVKKLIKKYHLENNVTFLGFLDENKMCDRFLKSNVFVCPSSIENSPNSVGEAMILGVPTISADVGGVKNQLVHEKEGFIYQADAPYMAAYYVKKIFGDRELAQRISEQAKNHAEITYNRHINMETLISIYKKVGDTDVQK